MQQQNLNNTDQQSQSLALPTQESRKQYEHNRNDTDIYSDTGTPINQTAGPLSSHSLLNDKLSQRRKSSRLSTKHRRSSSRASKGKQMQELYEKFRHAKQDDAEIIKKKAIRQLKKSFASEKSNRSHRSARDVDEAGDEDSPQKTATNNNAKNTTYNRTDTYDIYSNSAGAESQSNFNNQKSSTTGGHGSSIVGTRRIDIKPNKAKNQ